MKYASKATKYYLFGKALNLIFDQASEDVFKKCTKFKRKKGIFYAPVHSPLNFETPYGLSLCNGDSIPH